MKKLPTSGKSLLSSVAILFVFFTGIALAISNEVIFSYLNESRRVSPLLQIIAGFFFALLAGILLVQLWRLFWALRRNEPAIRYKIKMVMFFSIIVFMATIPTILLTANILRRAFDVWFVQDTNDSLKNGLENTLEYYQLRLENLRNFSTAELGQSLAWQCVKNPEAGWERLQSVNPGIDALQVFEAGGKELVVLGDQKLRPGIEKVRSMAGGPIQKFHQGGNDFLAASQIVPVDGDRQVIMVFVSAMPRDFDQNAEKLSRIETKLSEYRDFGLSFPLFVFVSYLLFLVPLIILAILMGLYVADMLIGPLVQMDEAVQRVSNGDFRTRVLSRNSDAMAPFISSFNRMVEELESSRQVIQQAERIQTWQDIAQRLAHEIKNPLTPIKLSAERILKKHDAKSPDMDRILRESVGIIVHEVEGLSRMLAEFRDFARLPLPVPESINVRDLVTLVWGLYAHVRQVKFVIDMAPGLCIEADRGQMHQIFKNLFQNALDAMGEAGGELSVRAYQMEKGGQHFVRIQVQDTGCGMTPQVLAQIFDPYFTDKKGGTGLGLAICEKIILDHGGRIWAESQVGAGSSFFIDIKYRNSGPDRAAMGE